MACKYIYKGITYRSKEEFINQVISPQFLSNKKVRRVMEVQSDLFQKGRDKKVLVASKDVPEIYPEELEDSNTPFREELKQNQFLQLLNKDNNWVTFFVKSIIQDSSKQNYEKVLFPSGNTASKIEGHTTLEEFKTDKQDRLKYLENLKDKNGLVKDEDGIPVQSNQSNVENEIDQIKKELEDVEKNGFGALKPIYNFYENTVTNILKKQGYNPVLITDEYGNTWNEVLLDDLSEKTILLDRSKNTGQNKSDITEKGFTNAKQYVEYIANNNEPLSPLARKLLSFNSNVPVIVTNNPYTGDTKEGDKVHGAFYPTKNEIRILPNVESKVILHEQIHAITYNWIRENKDSKQVKELERLFEITKTHASNIKDQYPLTNLDEFITGIFTNSQFVYDLQHIPYKSTNILTELLKWFSDLFRFTPKQETLFEEVFFRAEELLDTIKEEELGFELLENYDLESDYKSLLTKYGNIKTSEIRPQSEWGKLVSDIAKINKKYKSKVLTLYQAPNSKWYLKQIQDNNSPLFDSIPNHRQVAQLNSQEMKINLGEMGEDIVNNWNDYFDEYDFLSESDKRQYASLIEEGQVQIQCKF